MRETNAVQMLYVTIFMDHTIALVKKAITEMAKTAEVNIASLDFIFSAPFVRRVSFETIALIKCEWNQDHEKQRRTLKVPLIPQFGLNRENLKICDRNLITHTNISSLWFVFFSFRPFEIDL